MIDDYDIKVGIYSKEDLLISKLSQKFKDKNLEVKIFQDVNNLSTDKFNYIIINLLDKNINIQDLKKVISSLNSKIIVIHSLFVKPNSKYVDESNIKDLIEANEKLGVILVPEILSDGIDYNFQCVSHDLIMQSIVSERVKVKESTPIINTISISQLVDRIVKETFSFGISGQVLALVGPRITPKEFLTDVLGVSEKNIIFVKGPVDNIEIFRTLSMNVDFSVRLAAKATARTFSQKIEDDAPEPLQRSNYHKPKKRNYLNLLLKVTTLILFVFITPFFVLVVSSIFLYSSAKYMTKDTNLSESLLGYSMKTTKISQDISMGIPIYYNYSNIIFKTNTLLKEVMVLSKTYNGLVAKILGSDSYDLSFYSDNIAASLDKIYTDIGFLQSDINELDDVVGTKIKLKLSDSKFDLNRYKNKVYFFKNFCSRLSVLLGFSKPMKYLILFQNNMELRPTGGFIGSFALATFDGGKLTEVVVNDVYSADGQLKGHVDPPEPIRDVLGEGGWYMRDANWDPSFPDSAQKVEWFLDKEISTKVDGVIAIDLSFVQSLLKVIGPLKLVDFDKTVTFDNLYTNIQNEVESQFFPGSIKKQSFLTALSKQLSTEVQTLDRKKYFAFLSQVYKALEEKHIQIYLHDDNAQKAISDLEYSGEINLSTNCETRCFRDIYSLIDANLGVNKSNLYIKRGQEVNITVSQEIVDHELYVTYENSADLSVGKAGVYKNYARVLVPTDAIVDGVRLFNGTNGYDDINFKKNVINNRQEIEFLIEVLPGDTKKIQVVWSVPSSSLASGGEYNLIVKKQSGTDNDNLLINLLKGDLVLTGGAPAVYTTSLREDFKLKTFFKI